jgi:hypothetical protein
MFRFTIRDVLWLMVVVGMSVGWWLDHRRAAEVHLADLKDMLHRDLVLDIVEDVISKPKPDLEQLRVYLKSNRYEVFDLDADKQTTVPRR